jgi:hypothetical protein
MACVGRSRVFSTINFGELDVINLLGGPISERGSLVEVAPPFPYTKGDAQALAHLLQKLVDNVHISRQNTKREFFQDCFQGPLTLAF